MRENGILGNKKSEELPINKRLDTNKYFVEMGYFHEGRSELDVGLKYTRSLACDEFNFVTVSYVGHE